MTDPSLNLMLDELEDAGKLDDSQALLDAFAAWAESTGRPLYPHQAEAALQIFTDSHVIATTPTGSGKTMIGLAAHVLSLARGGRSYYTAPIKALVSEKFFDLVDLFGAANVGMLTGDFSINEDAPLICCTAEILANQALAKGADLDVDTVVMDEFHFYGEYERGWAWQVPLLKLPQAQMILMSATLGDVSFFKEDLEARTPRQVAVISNVPRPVPLELRYSEEPLHELVTDLIEKKLYPVYLVHFSQKDAYATAGALQSRNLLSREARDLIAQEIGDFKFPTAFGQKLSVLLRRGIGLHHAGMLPRYRRLVERLTQKGLLAVICGTDTLGVGINVPIRCVVLTSLTKFDGRNVRLLKAREFHQLVGRAGRAGFDTEGLGIIQAPPSVIESRENAKKGKKKPAPSEGKYGSKPAKLWNHKSFERLAQADPEVLRPTFQLTPAMVLTTLQAPGDATANLLALATDNHQPKSEANPLLRTLGQIYETLLTAEVIKADAAGHIELNRQLPPTFALNQTLAAFALAALELLDPLSPTFTLDCVSVVEAILEDPRPLLYAQEKAEKRKVAAALRMEGVEYNQRVDLIEATTWPKLLEELLQGAFQSFAEQNPWVQGTELSPKSVVRMMVENAYTFSDLVSQFEVSAAEGVVLRYLTDAYRALGQVVPPQFQTDELRAITQWLGQLIKTVDSSLLDEWEALESAVRPGEGEESAAPQTCELAFGAGEDGVVRLSVNRALLLRMIRRQAGELATFVALDQPEKLVECGFPNWDMDAFEHVLDRIWAEYDQIFIDQTTRDPQLFTVWDHPEDADFSQIRDVRLHGWHEGDADWPQLPANRWLVQQRLADDRGDLDWSIWLLCDLDQTDQRNQPVLSLLAISPH